jgi:hypothetical protein
LWCQAFFSEGLLKPARRTQLAWNRLRDEPAKAGSQAGLPASQLRFAFREVAIDERDGQTDHVEIAAFNFGNEFGRKALDGVGAGFVHGLAAVDVAVDFSGGHGGEPDGRGGPIDDQAAVAHETDAGEDLVAAVGEAVQHAAGVRGIGGFAEHGFVDDDGGVSTEDGFAVVAGGGEGFHLGYTLDVLFGDFARERGLINVGGADDEVEAGLAEDLLAARRTGGEHEGHGSIAACHHRRESG